MVEHPFHLAIQVRDIAEARRFYGGVLGFSEGRSAENWVDFDMYGHQLVAHLNPALGASGKVPKMTSGIDADNVPIPHFGVVLNVAAWDELCACVTACMREFVIRPRVRFAGQAGEQRTMFFLDPSGNALEFKAFNRVEESLFAV